MIFALEGEGIELQIVDGGRSKTGVLWYCGKACRLPSQHNERTGITIACTEYRRLLHMQMGSQLNGRTVTAAVRDL
jgi:hypothetical protein